MSRMLKIVCAQPLQSGIKQLTYVGFETTAYDRLVLTDVQGSVRLIKYRM